MNRERFAAGAIIFCWLLAGCVARQAEPVAVPLKSSDMVPRISKEELRSRLDDPSMIIVDVRLSVHWETSSDKIKGAIRENPEDVVKWCPLYHDSNKTIVLYCA